MKRQVVTRDVLNVEIQTLAKQFLQPWLEGNTLNFASVIMVAMQVVERYTSGTTGLSSQDKLNAALDLIPNLVDYAVEFGKMTGEQGVALKNQLQTGVEIVKQVISAYIVISKNPQFIQTVQAAEVGIKTCFAKCKKNSAHN
jgi:hypothetical protein